VFLRAVNVGGHQTFRPAALARELAPLAAVNIGAAGTLVIRKAMARAALRAELSRRLPFAAEVMICRAGEILDLVDLDPFASPASSDDARRMVTVMARRPRGQPDFPLIVPPAGAWQVRVIEVAGPFALSLWRPAKRAMLYPNAVIEKALGVAATTRSWGTFEKIRDVLVRG